jgi:N-methylhydantoinase B/oxoprolinase/acetone carboxylase alpha subunit
MTNSLNTPIEALENYLPILIRRYSLRKRSGGMGQFNGGNGILREYEFTVPTQITIMSERRKFAPYGLQGGNSGKKGNNILLSGKEKIRLRSKANLKAKPGDRLLIETPGGGGYGPNR